MASPSAFAVVRLTARANFVRQGEDADLISGCERVADDVHRLRLALKCIKGGREVLRTVDLERYQLHSLRSSRCRDLVDFHDTTATIAGAAAADDRQVFLLNAHVVA